MWEMFVVCSDRFPFLGEQAKGGRGVRVGRARAPREATSFRGQMDRPDRANQGWGWCEGGKGHNVCDRCSTTLNIDQGCQAR